MVGNFRGLLSLLICFLILGASFGSDHVRTTFRRTNAPWQEVAARKRKENTDKIPKEWNLPQAVLDMGKRQRKLKGEFIESLLDNESRRITGLGGVDVVENVRSGSLTASTSHLCVLQEDRI
jgi:hypothetical protein